MMKRSRNGIAPVLGLLALLAGGVPSVVGAPVAVDLGYGEEIGPDHFLYGMEKAGEGIRLAVIADHPGKAMMHLDLASERLQEVKGEIEAGRPEHIEALISAYRDNARSSIAESQLSEKPDVEQAVTDGIYNHVEVLNGIYANAPEQARFGLETAMEKSNLVGVLENALARRGDAGKIPVLPLPQIGDNNPLGEDGVERGAPVDIPGPEERPEVRGVDDLNGGDKIPEQVGELRDNAVEPDLPDAVEGDLPK